MEPNHSDTPSGSPQKLFKEPPHSRYSDVLLNQHWHLKQSETRNKLYLALIGLCVIGTIFVTVTSSYKTYVVRVNDTTGAVELEGQLKQTNYTPQQAEIRYYLWQTIRNIRTVPLDPVLYRQNWEVAAHFMSETASNKLSAFMAKDDQTKKLGHSTVQPEMVSMQLYPGTNNTYQVRWVEDEFSITGNPTDKKTHYVGLFMVTTIPPAKESDILVNPLGITIQDMTIDVETTASDTKGGSST